MDSKKRTPLHDNSPNNNTNFPKKPKPQQQNSPEKTHELYDDIFAELMSIDEDTAEELSKLLDTDTPLTPCPGVHPPCPVKFVSYPYLAPPVEFPCTSYITINGNEESCGSSYSDTDSSVMAGFDMAYFGTSSYIVDLDPPADFDGHDVAGARGGGGGLQVDDLWDWEVLLGGNHDDGDVLA